MCPGFPAFGLLPCFIRPACLMGLGLLVEVVVLSGLLGGVDVWWWDEPGGAVGHVDGPLFFVDEVVVVAAEEGAVVGAGGSLV